MEQRTPRDAAAEKAQKQKQPCSDWRRAAPSLRQLQKIPIIRAPTVSQFSSCQTQETYFSFSSFLPRFLPPYLPACIALGFFCWTCHFLFQPRCYHGCFSVSPHVLSFLGFASRSFTAAAVRSACPGGPSSLVFVASRFS